MTIESRTLNCPHCGRLISLDQKPDRPKVTCPECGSQRNYRNGKRQGKQTYLCQDCGYRFS